MAKLLRVLILEDRLSDAEIMVHQLRRAGFDPQWRCVMTKQEYLAQLQPSLDLILADYNLPQFNALQALQLLKERGLDVPFILVSGSIGEDLAIAAIRQGATDYLLKDRMTRLGSAVIRALEEQELRRERARAEAALRDSEKRYRTLIEQSTDGIALVDAQGIIQYVSPSTQRMFGYAVDDLVGRNGFGFIHPEDVARAQQDFTHTLASSNSVSLLTVRYRHKDGSWKWVEIAANNRLGDPTVRAIVLNFRDVTERKQYEEALRESEEKYRTILESIEDAYYEVDLAGNLTFFNDALCRLYGRAKTELIGMNYRQYMDPETSRSVYRTFHEVFQTGKSKSTFDWEVIRKDKSRRFVQVSISLMCAPGGDPIGFRGMIRDITERRRAEEELRQRAAHQSALNAIITAATPINADLQSLLQVALRETLAAFGVDWGAIWVTDKQGGPPIASVQGLPEEIITALRGAARGSGIELAESSVEIDWSKSPSPIAALLRAHGIHSSIGVPLITQGRRIGGLAIAATSPRRWSEEEAALAQAIGHQLGITVERARLFEETHTRAQQLETLNAAAARFQQNLDPHRIIQAACDELQRFGTFAAVFLASEDGTVLDHSYTCVGPDKIEEFRSVAAGVPRTFSFAFPVSVIPEEWQALRAGQTIIRAGFMSRVNAALPPDARTVGDWMQAQAHDGPVLLAPLACGDKTIGAIAVIGEQLDISDTYPIALFARHISVALENARLFEAEQARRSELAVLFDLSRALADTDDLDAVLSLIVRHTVERVHVTFARIALLEGADMVVRAAHPIRVLDRDLQVGCREVVAAHPSCGRALQANEPAVLYYDDPATAAADREMLFLGMAKSVCIVPLRAGDRAVGLLLLGEARNRAREPFTDTKIRLAHSIGDQAVSALRRAQLHAETEQRLSQVQALHAIDRAITSSVDLHVSLTVLLHQVMQLLGVDAVDVLLFNRYTHMLEWAAGRGFRNRAVEQIRLRLGDSYAGRVALERKTIHVGNLPAAGGSLGRAEWLTAEGFVAYVGTPLIAKGQIKGVLELYRRTAFEPDERWLESLESVAPQAAIAIDNSELYENLQRTNLDLTLAYDATLEGWSRALDLRDKETEGHTQRVTELTLRLAHAVGLPDGDMVHVRRGAVLHDIGKMGIPDKILLKPGPLSPEERAIMQQHPVYAYELLLPIVYLRSALDIPYGHHERWDGTGYPRGLKGEEIPLAARLFAVVDVWDALTSDRPYRKAWSPEEARQYVQEQRGKHFDPKVVERFLELRITNAQA